MDINIFLFDGFETLDIFGPVEIFAMVEGFSLRYFSMDGGIATSAQGVAVVTEPASGMPRGGVLVLPGGNGTRTLAEDSAFVSKLANLAADARFCLSICTGSGLYAKAGLLSGRQATSNKRAFSWAKAQGTDVLWVEKARWVVDGKFYTSSGVSAGMDMALGFVSDQCGLDTAQNVAMRIEYTWNSDPSEDPFALGI